MASWAALNADERDVHRVGALERATEEAQDAQNTLLYEQALRLQQQKQVTEMSKEEDERSDDACSLSAFSRSSVALILNFLLWMFVFALCVCRL